MLTRLCVVTAVLIGSAWPDSAPARAQAPATVSVRAELVTARFRNTFTDRKTVEAKVASLFADYLTREVGFLRFAANDTTLPYRLSLVLDHEPNNASSFAEVGFWVRLERPGEDPRAVYWLPFRTSDQSLAGVGSETDFLTEVKSKLAHQSADSLNRAILSSVPIAETGIPNLNPLGLVLPFSLFDLCMKNQSIIQFIAEIQGTITMEEPFTAQIVGSAAKEDPFFGGGFGKVIDLKSPDDLSPSITSNKVRVKKIFVTDYKLDRTACDNRAPRTVGGGAP